MEKVRVYELAKELNTTSKRLMEKLAEINVDVKNHMSLLEDHELQALYKHIGIRKQDDRKAEAEERKPVSPRVESRVEPRVESKKDVKKDVKSAPRIIRTTEIILDAKNDVKETAAARNEAVRRDNRYDTSGGNRNHSRQDFVRVADANSGLRAGYVRDVKPEYRKDMKGMGKPVDNRPVQRDSERVQEKQEQKNELKQDVKPDVRQDAKPEIRQEAKQEAKQETRMEPAAGIKPETKSEVRPDERPVEDRDKPREVPQEIKETNKTQMTGNEPVQTEQKHQSRNIQHNDRPREQNRNDHFRSNRPQTGEGQRNNAHYNRDNRPQYDNRDKRPQYDNRDNRPQYANRDNRPQYDNRDNRPQYDNRGNQPQYDNRNDHRPGNPNRAPGDRQGQGNTYQGNRGPSDRPKGEGFSGNRGEGYAANRQGGRPGDRRPQGGPGARPGNKPLEIPKPDLTLVQNEEISPQRLEAKREFQNKDFDKDAKREQRKESPKGQNTGKGKKFKPQTVVLTQKKGVSEVLSEDFILEEFYDDEGVARTRKTAKPKRDSRGNIIEPKYIPKREVLTNVTIPESITVKDLAEVLKKTSTEVIKKLMGMGMMATLNQELDFDTASLIADEFGIKTEKAVVVNEEDILFDDSEENPEGLEPRPPVVVVMGHVDHGKTSLLDAIRKTNVTDKEAGGITQHIGAYMVRINNRNITFLDTPGHEAFTAMRARGAQVTDIAILVVAADDGVMPQTVEAINHAKAANVSIIVAINKIDKPGANPDRVKQELTEYELVAEEWGGDVICVPVSAKTGENIEHLLEMVLLTADILELKANPDRQAKGTIIEAKLDKNRGPIATVLVQRGTLSVGDSIVTGTTVGRIRAMVDDKGNSIKKAGPSTPVEILGMPEVPEAGEIFYAITDERVARQLAEKRKLKQREQQMKQTSRVSLEDLFSQIKEGKVKDLNIIVKADVQGSVEAVKQSLEKLSNDEVRVKIIHGGVGAITESDVTLAEVSNAIIIGFNVRPGPNVAEQAENSKVDLRLYRVIYNAIEDIQAAMKGMLEPTFKEVILGHTEVRQIFKVSGVGTIGGCYVTDGKIMRNSDIRVIRDGIVIHEGKLASLKRFKDDVKEAVQGFECGLSVERFNDIKEGDIVEAYMMEEVAR